MIKNNVIYISFLNNILRKIFFLLITIFSLTISVKLYTYVVLLFILSNYIYEFSSLSIPKVFNNYSKIYGIKKLSILVGYNFYISMLIFFIFIILFKSSNFLDLINLSNTDNYFIYGFLILGFSIFLNDVVDKYNFLHLNHQKIYYYDFFELVINFIFILLIFFKFNTFEQENFFIIIFIYAIIKITLSLIKLFVFKLDITFNVKKIYLSITLKEYKSLLNLIIPIFIISILFLLQLSISRFIILFYEDYSSFAIFAFHIQVVELITLFFMSIHQLSTPKVSILFRNQEKKPLLILQSKLLIVFYSIVPILFLFIYFLIIDVTKILNIDIEINGVFFLILALNTFFIYLFFTFYQYMIMNNQTKFLIIITLLSLIINIILSFIFTYFYSIIGLTIANLISNLFLFYFCNRRVNFFFFRSKDSKNIIIFILRFFSFVVLINYYYLIFPSENGIISLFLKTIFISMIFLVSEVLVHKNIRTYNVLNAFVKTINYRIRTV